MQIEGESHELYILSPRELSGALLNKSMYKFVLSVCKLFEGVVLALSTIAFLYI